MTSSKGDTAVVTGAGQGIGRAVAIQLAERGFDVALLARGTAELEDTKGARVDWPARARPRVRRLESKGRRACRFRDARNLRHAESPREQRRGHPARARRGDDRRRMGRGHRREPEGSVPRNAGVLAVDVAGRRGRLVATSSISATLGTARQSAYAAAKWGALGFTKSLAEELRGTGLQTMAVMPGAVATSMLEGSGFLPQMTAEDVARTVLFAALDAPDAMNRSAIEIFGP